MKKPAPPKLGKAELMEEATRLLRVRWPDAGLEPAQFLLTYFNGWDLEVIIQHLQDPKWK